MAQLKYLGLNSLREMISQNDLRYVKKSDEKTYSIERLATAEESYAATYQLVDEDGVKVGEYINIPRDYLVRSAEIKAAETENQPVDGLAVGDKYIEFVVNSVDDGGTESKIYLPISDLASAYTAGNGIDLSNANKISLKLDATNANGLSVGVDGLSLGLASATQAGAMSAADYTRLNEAVLESDLEEITADEVAELYSGGPTPTPTPTTEKVKVKFFDAAGENELFPEQEIDKGGKATDPGVPTDVPAGMASFAGWKVSMEENAAVWNFEDAVNAAMNLYASWAAE